jgi:lipid-A-disaccharide synthase
LDAASTTGSPIILFTAFEPSGDAHAAPVIAELLRVAPHLKIYACGGEKMEQAGAKLISRTADDGSMGVGALGKIGRVRKEIRGVKRWCRANRLLLHVPVDSPAANFPICKFVRRKGCRIVHLVAPQVWAWGGWRIGKLRRRTDLVLCLLPFEEQWFNDRDVPARFIGHPAINRELDDDAIAERCRGLPHGSPRIALFPGSRSQEVTANIRLLASAFNELQGRHSGAAGVIVAANPELAKLVRGKLKIFPTGLHMVTGDADEVIGWCDLALAVSGTVTLHIARQCKPMIGVYRTSILSWLLSKVILRAPYRLLPNIIAEREIVPEFVPHPFGPAPVVREASRFLNDSKHAAILTEQLRRVILRFANKRPAEEAAALILKILKDGVV